MFVFYRAILGIMAGYGKAVRTFAEYVKRLHTVKEQVCVVEIESFVNGGADEE